MKIDTSKLKFPKPRKRKKLTIPKLRDKAWRVFSLYIRLSDADKYGYVGCVTCGKRGHYKDMQAGHFKHGKDRECYFDERNVHPQCVSCNHFHKTTAMQNYTVFMLKKYGQKVVEELLDSKKIIWKREVLEDILGTYKRKLKELNESSQNM